MHAGRQKGKVCDACSRIYRICLSAPLLYSWQTKVTGTCRWGTPLCPCARFSFVSQSSHCIPISHALPPLPTSQKMTLTQSLTIYSTPTAIQQPTLPSLPDFTSDIPSPHTPSHSCPPLPPSALLATAALFPPPTCLPGMPWPGERGSHHLLKPHCFSCCLLASDSGRNPTCWHVLPGELASD